MSNNSIMTVMRWFLVFWAVVNLTACGKSGMDDRQLIQSAKAYLEKDELRSAAIELRNALQKNPGNGEARYLLGSISLDLGDADAAKKEFRLTSFVGPIFISFSSQINTLW